MNEIDIVRDISRRFDQTGINYMLTGSMAMNYYAQPRMTRDIDIVIAITHQDVERVGALFRPDYYVSEKNIRESLDLGIDFQPYSSRKRHQSGLYHPQEERIPAPRI